MLPMKMHKSLIWKKKKLTPEMREEIKSLPELTVNELREKFAEVLGYGSHSRNRSYLIRKLTWAIQAKEWGDISPETRTAAHQLADLRFLRLRMPHNEDPVCVQQDFSVVRKKIAISRDPRLPMPGCIITRDYGDKHIEIRVREQGFEFEGRTYRSLSAIAREVTGTNWNGFAFFGLGGER